MTDSGFRIPTSNLTLVLQTRDEVLAWLETMPPPVRAEVSADWIARVKHAATPDPWVLGFIVVERAGGSAIGSCGFKGPPDADGIVEVAYGIDPAFRGRGYATEAARALTAFALSTGGVRLVRAHTRPDNDASARVLERCGFVRVGAVTDPEDGLLHRWERRPARATSA